MKSVAAWAVRHRQWLLTAMYALLAATFLVAAGRKLTTEPRGDERFYVRQAESLLEDGFMPALRSGNPVGLTCPMALLHAVGLPLLQAGRLISLLSVIPLLLGVFCLSRRILALDRTMSHVVLVSSILAVFGSNYFWNAIADPLFSASLLWGLIYVWKSVEEPRSWPSPLSAGVLSAVSVWIRPLFLLYLPSICLAIGVALMMQTENRRRCLLSGAVILGIFSALFLLWQLPSLTQNGRIAFENKGAGKPASWGQRQFLAQLQHDEGTLPEGKHPSWEEVTAYLDVHGEDSLPRGIIERIQQYPGVVVKEFFKDLLISSNYIFLRRTGLLYLLAFMILVQIRAFREADKSAAFFFVIWFSYACALSFLIVTNIEWRWLIVPVLLACATGGVQLQYLFQKRIRAAVPLLTAQLAFFVLSFLADVRAIFS